MKKVYEKLVASFKNELSGKGFKKLVLGLSGGLDSALAAKISTDAWGCSNIEAFYLPYKTSSSQSRADAEIMAAHLGIKLTEYDITHLAVSFKALLGELSSPAFNNILSRIRMTLLFDRSAFYEGIVVGTANKSELLLGYNTIYGDSACAVNPLGDLYKTQIRQMAAQIGIPQKIIDKAPSADYYEGQTDESDIGYSYSEIDLLLIAYIEDGLDRNTLINKGFQIKFIDDILRRIDINAYKRHMPVIISTGQNNIYIDK